MVTDRAFWFKSDAKQQVAIPLNKGETHIQQIINNPEIFGETENSVIETYKIYNENLGLEGEARGVILVRVKSRGWLRSRFYKSQSRWIIDIDNYSLRKKIIYKFIIWIIERKYLSPKYDEIQIFDDKEFVQIIKGQDQVHNFLNMIR